MTISISLFIFSLVVVFTAVRGAPLTTTRPIVGVITQPTEGNALAPVGSSVITASIVKFVESGGARVVPIPYNASEKTLVSLFNSVNGIFFPGGPDIINHTLYYNASAFLFSLALKANNGGDYFPIWGTCLGFELISMIVADGNFSVLSHFDAENITMPLIFTPAAKSSRLFLNAQPYILEWLSTYNLTSNFHHYGLGTSTFNSHPELSKFFSVLSTNVDRQGLSFISTVEAFRYPIYGIQWHPEFSLFEWDPMAAVNHSPMAIETMQYFSRFFVNECLKNAHSFPTQEEEIRALIDNYHTTFSGPGYPELNYFL